MIDPKTNPGSEEHETIERYDLEVAPRVRNLPPYLFGRINELKYRKRRDGIDVIDLGMGNPTDPPEEWVIDKLCEAARDSRNHRYSVATGIYNLRREVANRYESRFGVSLDPDQEIVATIGSKEGFSHMCLALLGPGDTALVPAPSFPIHIHAVALASANVISLDVRDASSFLSNIARTCESLYPRPKILVINYPHNPTATVVDQPFFEEIVALAKKYRFFVIHDFAYGDIGFDGYQPPSFLVGQRGQERRLRIHHDVQGLQHGRLARGFRRRQPRHAGCAQGDQGLLRLRDLPGRPGRGDRGPAAWRSGPAGPGRRVPDAARRVGSRAEAHGLGPRSSPGRDVCLDADSRALAVASRLDRLRHEAARRGQRRRQSRARLRRDRRRLPPPRPGRKRQRLRQAVRQIARCLRPEKAVSTRSRTTPADSRRACAGPELGSGSPGEAACRR